MDATSINRVVIFSEFGGPEVLHLEQQPLAEPGPGEVRVRMAFAGLNPVDYKIRRGGPQYGTQLPSTLGRELSGVVESTGAEVERLAVGDPVFGSIPVGAFADAVIVPEANMAFVPDDLPMDVAGALALAGQTAWDALASQGIRRGDTIVVSAAAGGVGGILAQLAVHAGARVIGSASRGNHAWLRSRGVEPVEYGPGFADAVRALVDSVPTAAFDLHGLDSVEAFLGLGIPAERINSNAMGAAVPAGVQRVGRGAPNVDTLGTLAAMVVDGAVEVPIAGRYRLEHVGDAFELLEGQHLRGKVVVSGND
ncbi:MAG TPA: NADP-dependent oxidoreductase [Pseudolysinimonas sp.]|nr:NADP-dependent oxidoreductase [Pseudolysinimonas sp.]